MKTRKERVLDRGRGTAALCSILLLSPVIHAQLQVKDVVPSVTFIGNGKKTATETTITSPRLTVTIRIKVRGQAPPQAAPTFTLDLYDEDVIWDDALGVDATQATATPWRGGWTFVKGTARANGSSWRYRYDVASITLNASDIEGEPDPMIKVVAKVTIGTGANAVTTEGEIVVAAPDLPPIGSADYGVLGSSRAANSLFLSREPISAMSRGHDAIARLGSGAALYFVSDLETQSLSPPFESTPGQAFVLDDDGELWPETIYAAGYDPKEAILHSPRYLNVPTAPPGATAATREAYFVREGKNRVLYSASGDPGASGVFLDLGTSRPVTGLAVEDVVPRGVWSPGDAVLYALDGSAEIFRLDHGAAPVHLTVNGQTFDGSTQIFMWHFEPTVVPAPSLVVGNIRALSVAAPDSATPTPADRVSAEVVEYFAEIPRGLGAPARVFADGSGVLQVEAALASRGVAVSGLRGAARAPVSGHYLVTAAGPGAGGHLLVELDAAGRYVGVSAQPPGAQATSSGIHDLACDLDPDPAAVRIWGGAEGNVVYEYDPDAGAFTGRTIPLQGYPNPSVRALAIARLDLGSGLQPAFVAADYGTPLYLFDMGGRLRGQVPWTYGALGGLAWDDARSTLWAHVRDGGGPQLMEVDPATGLGTGQVFHLDDPAALPGGLELCPVNPWGGFLFLTVARRTSDYVATYHGPFAYGDGQAGQIGFRSEARIGNPGFQVTLEGASGSWAALLAGIPFAPPGTGLPSISNQSLLLDPSSFVVVGGLVPIAGGRASMPLPIPPVFQLIGGELGLQWMTWTPPSLPIDMSDAGVIHIR